MSDDLVVRLRFWANRADQVFDPSFASPWREAAAEIERLRAKNERMREAVAAAMKVREMQKLYFATRTRDALIASKGAESAFDEIARAALSPVKSDEP
jgi:hypothetical protein